MKYDGVYSGFVASVDGATSKEGVKSDGTFQKIKVIVPGIDAIDADINVLPNAVVRYNRAGDGWGEVYPVLPKDSVIVEFEGGDPTRRIITGMAHGSWKLPVFFAANYPHREGFVSRGGHLLAFDNFVDYDVMRSFILMSSIGGNSIRMRDFYSTLEGSINTGAKIVLRGTASDSDDTFPTNVGVLITGNPDVSVSPLKNYTIKFDEENLELEIKSREGYTVTLRDKDASGGSVNKGITVKTQTGREIVIDEEDGKIYIRNTDEIHLSGSKVVVDSDLEVNGKIDATDNISTLGEVFDTYMGVPSNLSQHDHTIPPPQGGTTIPPRTP